MLFNSDCFEKFILKSHFQKHFFVNSKLKNVLDTHESKISEYLSYCILSEFIDNGYEVPVNENSVPMADVDKIFDENGRNILNIFNSKKTWDIDVLVGDSKKRIIYNIEIKYNQAIINLNKFAKEIRKKKEDTLRGKLIKAKRREDILSENIEAVLNFLNIKTTSQDDFKVKTIVVSIKPDPFLKKASKELELQYDYWGSFISKIKNGL